MLVTNNAAQLASFNLSSKRKPKPEAFFRPSSASLHFAGLSESQKKTSQETIERIKKTDGPLLRKSVFKIFIMSLLGPIFPASRMPTLVSLTKLFKSPQLINENINASAQSQANFLVTRDLNALNDYLPYRKRLTETGDQKALANYDAVLHRVLNEAEFYETRQPKEFQKQLNKTWKTEAYRTEDKELTEKDGFKGIWSLFSNRTYRQNMMKSSLELTKKHIAKVSNDDLSKPFKSLQSLAAEDIATRYLIAGQIADLLYKNPQYLDHVLKPKNGNPMRFVITKDSPTMAVGSFLPGLNTITLNKTFLWLRKGTNTTAQHEFIHASSAQDSLVGDLLPYMSPAQQEKFKTARSWLVQQHETKGSSIVGKLKYWLTGKTVTGIRNYCYWNDYEFLTVTLDAFKTNPKGLCHTDAGKQIYETYKELFGLDPLMELQKQ